MTDVLVVRPGGSWNLYVFGVWVVMWAVLAVLGRSVGYGVLATLGACAVVQDLAERLTVTVDGDAVTVTSNMRRRWSAELARSRVLGVYAEQRSGSRFVRLVVTTLEGDVALVGWKYAPRGRLERIANEIAMFVGHHAGGGSRCGGSGASGAMQLPVNPI